MSALPPRLRALGGADVSYPVSISEPLRATARSVDALESAP